MATVKFKGNDVHTVGQLPKVGSKAPDFKLVKQDLSEVSLASYRGRKKILSIFPSIDTSVCATSVRTFNEKGGKMANAVVLNVSADLPFAAKRFCGAEGLSGVETLSTFRGTFANDYGVRLADGPLAGLCARAVVVLDGDDKVVHAELVSEITHEPNYDAALQAAR